MTEASRPRLKMNDPPCLKRFKDEKIVAIDETRIDRLAFDVGEAFGHQRRGDALSLGRRQKAPNLSISRPEQLPTATTFSASLTAGMAIAHSSVTRRTVKLWSRLPIMLAIRGGSNSTIMRHDNWCGL